MERIVFITDHAEKAKDIYTILKSMFPECEVIIVPRNRDNQSLIQDEESTIRYFCMENFENCSEDTASK